MLYRETSRSFSIPPPTPQLESHPTFRRCQKLCSTSMPVPGVQWAWLQPSFPLADGRLLLLLYNYDAKSLRGQQLPLRQGRVWMNGAEVEWGRFSSAGGGVGSQVNGRMTSCLVSSFTFAENEEEEQQKPYLEGFLLIGGIVSRCCAFQTQQKLCPILYLIRLILEAMTCEVLLGCIG